MVKQLAAANSVHLCGCVQGGRLCFSKCIGSCGRGLQEEIESQRIFHVEVEEDGMNVALRREMCC